jgi:hypothetical protein
MARQTCNQTIRHPQRQPHVVRLDGDRRYQVSRRGTISLAVGETHGLGLVDPEGACVKTWICSGGL